MTLTIALLRAVNVGGTGNIPMADLRAFFDTLGFGQARTLIQTGNVVFECDTRSGVELETFLEQEALGRLGLDTIFFIRSPDELEEAIKANPFIDKARDAPSRLHLMALKDPSSAQNVTALEEAISGPERIHALGRHLYIDYPDGAGNSKLTNVLIERKLEMRGTARNWNTTLKIADMVRAG